MEKKNNGCLFQNKFKENKLKETDTKIAFFQNFLFYESMIYDIIKAMFNEFIYPENYALQKGKYGDV